jgi:hypothetical protein
MKVNFPRLAVEAVETDLDGRMEVMADDGLTNAAPDYQDCEAVMTILCDEFGPELGTEENIELEFSSAECAQLLISVENALELTEEADEAGALQALYLQLKPVGAP